MKSVQELTNRKFSQPFALLVRDQYSHDSAVCCQGKNGKKAMNLLLIHPICLGVPTVRVCLPLCLPPPSLPSSLSLSLSSLPVLSYLTNFKPHISERAIDCACTHRHTPKHGHTHRHTHTIAHPETTQVPCTRVSICVSARCACLFVWDVGVDR